jgi:PTH1 family peptidyl-tRNA hydrolase
MSDAVASGVWLVVGLGNPGREYEQNRHNIGFHVADLLAVRMGIRFSRHRRAVAEVAEGRLGVGADAPRVVLAKPMTYMNLSGGPVAALRQFYKITTAQILALHDELDVPFGQVRAKFGGGEGGHNGLRSMSQSLGTKDYARTRFGIGRPPGRQDPADFVLSNFSPVQRKELDFLIDRAADIAETIMIHGVESAQNTFHAPAPSARELAERPSTPAPAAPSDPS